MIPPEHRPAMVKLAEDIGALCAKSELPPARMISAALMGLGTVISATLPDGATHESRGSLAKCCADSLAMQIMLGCEV